MGLSYTSLTLRGPEQGELAYFLLEMGREAFVSPTVNGCTVVYDRQSEQREEALKELAGRSSARFRCPALAALLHDGGILWYQLYDSGSVVDEYDSNPGYFTSATPLSPCGGDAERLCAAFHVRSAVTEVESVLRMPNRRGENSDSKGWIAAEDRHRELVRVLHLPSFAAGLGFYGLEDGQLPEGIDRARFRKVSISEVATSDGIPPRQLPLWKQNVD